MEREETNNLVQLVEKLVAESRSYRPASVEHVQIVAAEHIVRLEVLVLAVVVVELERLMVQTMMILRERSVVVANDLE